MRFTSNASWPARTASWRAPTAKPGRPGPRARRPSFRATCAGRPPKLGWSLRTILRREYNSLCLVTTAFFVLQLGRGTLRAHVTPAAWLRMDPTWDAIFAVGVLAFLVLRTLKRHTRLLHVAGR